ncbi:hypothetical protein KSF_056610 [Reticulibacter mediterranei]|uniref:Uncharacterized protein n=2 Tax=Reticulibacter mediterranei TaxID=2778369 RepID=A0A8J3IKR4_9CHLR|nr:hypothetical protein KSF_056610 [Reticulibacter mediterranei]
MTMIASFPSIFKDIDSLPTKTIIHSLARYAVAHDKVLETADVSFRVDGRGNVLMVEPKRRATRHQKASSHQEKCIIVPRQEAYERIMYATRKKMEQMRSLYEGVQKRSRGWTKISLFVVLIAMLCILLSAIAAVVFNILQEQSFWFLLLLFINLSNLIIMGYLLWQARRYSGQANSYLNSLLQIENFYETVNTASELLLDDTARELFQEVIIAQSLGVQGEDVEIRDEGSVLFF